MKHRCPECNHKWSEPAANQVKGGKARWDGVDAEERAGLARAAARVRWKTNMSLEKRLADVCTTVPGYSGAGHIDFWSALMSHQGWSRLLMLGVYYGRDLSLLCELAKEQPDRQFTFAGVDKFDDVACADWPDKKKKLGWEAAGFGSPPSFSTAHSNIEKHKPTNVTMILHEHDDSTILRSKCQPFDIVYLDTAHDYETVKRQIGQMKNISHPDTLICGDDYSDEGTWGVKRAVSEAFPDHHVSAGWIWSAPFNSIKT